MYAVHEWSCWRIAVSCGLQASSCNKHLPLQDIEELIEAFKTADDTNFTLLQFVHALHAEIAQLDAQVRLHKLFVHTSDSDGCLRLGRAANNPQLANVARAHTSCRTDD